MLIMQNLPKSYEKSNSMEKLIILLPLFDNTKYSEEATIKYFQCSKYKVDQARKLLSSTKGLEILKKTKISRNKLDLQKRKHVLDFLFSNKFFQDMAYGVINIKFDSGDSQKIAHAVLVTGIHMLHYIILPGSL